MAWKDKEREKVTINPSDVGKLDIKELGPISKPPGEINHITSIVEKTLVQVGLTYVLRVDYETGRLETYNGVVLQRGEDEVQRWTGKGFNQDWLEATNYCEANKLNTTMDDSVHKYNQDVARQ